MTETIVTPADPFRKHAHPLVYMFLVLPFGVTSGFIVVTYAYLLSHAGVSAEKITALIALSLLPQTFKFIWAPLVDTTLSLKKWYVLSGILTALSIFAMGMVPINNSSLTFLSVVAVLMNFAVSFLGSTCNGLAAYDIPDEKKGLVSGYLNAGNLGGQGVGGGAGLWLAKHTSHVWVSPAIIAVSCALCAFALYFVKEPKVTVRHNEFVATVNHLLKDVWQSVKVPMGFMALILCFLPLCTGAASNLWATVADTWKASAGTVEFVTGVASGLITAAGSLLGGWICDRYDRKNAYVLFGLMQVLCAVGMAYSPHTQLMYIVWTSLYAIIVGLSYAGFSAFVFEAIGKGAAATKFTVFASLSNVPIAYMTVIEGWAFSHYKEKAIGMLDAEAICGVIGIVLFLGLAAVVKQRKAVAVVAEV
jgi:MFS family permease